MKTFRCPFCDGEKTKRKEESWPTFHKRACSTACAAKARESKKRGSADVNLLNSVLDSFRSASL